MFLETAKEVDQKFQIHFFQSFGCEKHLPLTGKNICTYLLLKLVWWYQAQKSLSLLRSYAPAQWIMDLNLQHCSRPLLMTSKCKRHRVKLVVEYSYSKKTTHKKKHKLQLLANAYIHLPLYEVKQWYLNPILHGGGGSKRPLWLIIVR